MLGSGIDLTVEETALTIPGDFGFPFPPYTIQTQFMKALFTAIDQRKLGIFESPTGTGKSLSLICGSLTWLERREAERLKELQTAIQGFHLEEEERRAREAGDWVSAQHALRQKKDKMFRANRELTFLQEHIQRRKKVLNKKAPKPARRPLPGLSGAASGNAEEEEEEDFDLGPESDLSEEEDQEPEFDHLKVIFASRTHSQLRQFGSELRKTTFGSRTTSACLASRQTLCVNPGVKRLKTLSLMNEACLELQRGGKKLERGGGKKAKGCTGCEYYNNSAIEELKNHILQEPRDIEDLVQVGGREYRACPYYASRRAAREAQLVLVPYNTLLHGGTRDGVGLRTQGAVVVVDEAHNLLEAIANIHAATVTLPQLTRTALGLKTYTAKYMARFSAKNLLKLKQLSFVLKGLARHLKESPAGGRVFGVREFKAESGLEELDLYELIRFMSRSKLVHKLKTTLDGLEGGDGSEGILPFADFLQSIGTCGMDGRVLQEADTLKFMLLNPSQHFEPILGTARSVILAGGTMRPYADLEDQLFHSTRSRITHFSCSHVIPPKNLLCLSVSKGPTAVSFDFTFKNRTAPKLMDELCRTVLNVSRVVPGGLVIFLPSYEYESRFYNHLSASGVLALVQQRKKLFREPKDGSVERVLSDYSREIRKCRTGAGLLAVVGGKLSEGINFGDELGRCVVLVGLPYPNITSLEVKEKVKFVGEKFGAEKGKDLLRNACFKAVNQSIGRAIRHAADYAAILLVDQRYESSSSQLPGWIQERFTCPTTFGQSVSSLAGFFAVHQQQSK